MHTYIHTSRQTDRQTCMHAYMRDILLLFSLVQVLGRLGSGEHEGRFSRDLLPIFSPGGHREQFWHGGQDRPLLDVVHPAFPPPTTASLTLRDISRDGFGEAVVAYGMPDPCEFSSLDSCQKRFLQTHKEVNLVPHPVVGLTSPSKRCGEVSSGTWSGKPDSFSQSQQVWTFLQLDKEKRNETCTFLKLLQKVIMVSSPNSA